MSTIDFEKILEYVAGFKRPLVKGSLLAKSKTHFFGYGRLPDKPGNANDSITTHFITSCLSHKLKDKPLTVEVLKTVRNDDVEIKGLCTCKANINRCKHIVGFMLKLERLSLSEIPIVSQTDVARRWGALAVNKKRVETQTPCRFSNLCHVKPKECKYKPLPTVLPDDVVNFVIEDLMKVFPDSIFSKSMNNASNEPVIRLPVDPLPLSRIFEAVFDENPVVELPFDVLVELYANCEDDEIYFFHDHVDVTREDIENICKLTKYQNTDFWKAQRQIRITGRPSYSYYTYFTNPKANWQKKLQPILSLEYKPTADMIFGSLKEGPTKAMYKRKNKLLMLANVGMIVNPKLPWFSYSADGFVIVDGELVLVEVKVLKIGRKFVGLEFLKRVPFLFLNENNEWEMRRNHEYYGQIQLGLFNFNLKKAKLLLYVHKNKTVEAVDVHINVPFLHDYVLTLTKVYFQFFLPFLCANAKDLRINSENNS